MNQAIASQQIPLRIVARQTQSLFNAILPKEQKSFYSFNQIYRDIRQFFKLPVNTQNLVRFCVTNHVSGFLFRKNGSTEGCVESINSKSKILRELAKDKKLKLNVGIKLEMKSLLTDGTKEDGSIVPYCLNVAANFRFCEDEYGRIDFDKIKDRFGDASLKKLSRKRGEQSGTINPIAVFLKEDNCVNVFDESYNDVQWVTTNASDRNWAILVDLREMKNRLELEGNVEVLNVKNF